MKSILCIPLSLLCAVCGLSCNKDEIGTVEPSVALQAISLDTSHWKCWMEPHTYLTPAPGVYEVTSEGLKIYGPAYRSNIRLHPVPVSAYPIMGKTVYLKWKINGGGKFMGAGPNIVTDTTDWTLFGPITNLTTSHAYAGSTVVSENVWYFTRIVFTGSSFAVSTALNTYESEGGTVVETRSGALGRSYKVVTFGIWDMYAGTVAYGVLGEARVE